MYDGHGSRGGFWRGHYRAGVPFGREQAGDDIHRGEGYPAGGVGERVGAEGENTQQVEQGVGVIGQRWLGVRQGNEVVL